jgi:hypothetical protein
MFCMLGSILARPARGSSRDEILGFLQTLAREEGVKLLRSAAHRECTETARVLVGLGVPMLWQQHAQDESALDMAGMLAESGLRSSMRLWLRGWPINEPSLPSVWLRRQLQAAILSAGRLGMPLPLELWWQVAHFLMVRDQRAINWVPPVCLA